MPGLDTSEIGVLVDIQGSAITIALTSVTQDEAPTTTIGSTDVPIGQLGSYVIVTHGDSRLLAVTTRMTERERLIPYALTQGISTPIAERTLTAVPIGTIDADGHFSHSIASYPPTGSRAHAILPQSVAEVFRPRDGAELEIGGLSAYQEIRPSLSINRLFGHHFAILGQTGFGKSWTVASIVQRVVASHPGAHIILLDLHGEYKAAFSDDARRLHSLTTLPSSKHRSRDHQQEISLASLKGSPHYFF